MPIKEFIDILSLWALPAIILIILTVALIKKVPIYEAFIEGAKDGVNATFSAIESGSETVISIAAPAINLLANNMNVLLSVLGPVAAGYGALKIISVVSAAHQKFVEDGTKAANTLKAIRDASSLAAEASNRQKTALEAARAAEMLNTSALEAERKALEARTQASRLDSQAKKAEEAAAKAAQSALCSFKKIDTMYLKIAQGGNLWTTIICLCV